MATPNDPVTEDEVAAALAPPGEDAGSGATEDAHHDDLPEDDDDDPTGKRDTELDSAATDEEREAIRAARREEKKTKRQRARERQASKDRELEMLKRKVAELEQHKDKTDNIQHGAQLAQLEAEIQRVTQVQAQLKDVIANAATKGDGARVAEATNRLIHANDRSKELHAYKAQAEQVRTTPKAMDPAMAQHVQSFLGRHKWYQGVASSDVDSMVLNTLDNSVKAAGFDPTSKEYWDELESRIERTLPHRAVKKPPTAGRSSYNSDSGAPAAPGRSPVAGASGSGPSNGGRVAVGSISAERVKAIKEAGAWDNPEKRKRMIESYRKFDRENGITT